MHCVPSPLALTTMIAGCGERAHGNMLWLLLYVRPFTHNRNEQSMRTALFFTLPLECLRECLGRPSKLNGRMIDTVRIYISAAAGIFIYACGPWGAAGRPSAFLLPSPPNKFYADVFFFVQHLSAPFPTLGESTSTQRN